MQKSELSTVMTEVTDKRIRWSKEGSKTGPVIVLFVGIHGNEPAGIKAVDRLAESVEKSDIEFYGSVYAISGNIKALELGIRYLDTDLNRLWENMDGGIETKTVNGAPKSPAEYEESLEIKESIDQIIRKHRKEASDIIFADLHTTSSRSCAFILLNDTLSNREIARTFPVPQILGIEENIHGTLLSYINNLGYKAIGFEAGAHNDEISIERSEAFLWLLMDYNKVINLPSDKKRELEDQISVHSGVPDVYFEIRHHKLVKHPEKFQMISGFQNFDLIEKDIPLAYENDKLLRAPMSGRIFMPLYQKVGHDGYLIIREVSGFWLELSAYFRNSYFHTLLKYLPGVSLQDQRSYLVNLRVARFLVKEIFHLLGYRVYRKDEHTLICYKR